MLKESPVVTVTVPDQENIVNLARSGTTLTFSGRGVHLLERDFRDWRDLQVTLRSQINRGRTLQLKMSPSEGQLRIVGGLNGMILFNHAIGDLPDELTDEFIDAVSKANFRLAAWTGRKEAA